MPLNNDMGNFKQYYIETEFEILNNELQLMCENLIDEGVEDSLRNFVQTVGTFTYPILKSVYEPIVDKLIEKDYPDKKEELKEKLKDIKVKLMSIISKNAAYKDVYKRTFEPLMTKVGNRVKDDSEMKKIFSDYLNNSDAGVAQGYELDVRNYISAILTKKERIALRNATIRLKPILGTTRQDKRMWDVLTRLPDNI